MSNTLYCGNKVLLPGHALARGVTVTVPPASVAAVGVIFINRTKLAVSTVDMIAPVGVPSVPSPAMTCHVSCSEGELLAS